MVLPPLPLARPPRTAHGSKRASRTCRRRGRAPQDTPQRPARCSPARRWAPRCARFSQRSVQVRTGRAAAPHGSERSRDGGRRAPPPGRDRGSRARRTVVVLALLVVGAFIVAFLAGSREGIVPGGRSDRADRRRALLVRGPSRRHRRGALVEIRPGSDGFEATLRRGDTVCVLSQLGKYVPELLSHLAARAAPGRLHPSPAEAPARPPPGAS